MRLLMDPVGIVADARPRAQFGYETAEVICCFFPRPLAF
jgi:hypothetical protein